MNFVAIKMLTGDRSKYLGLIFAIAFAPFLLENQSSIFAGIMKRTTSQILDVTDADIWVMDANTEYIDEIKALTENDLYRVREVPGVQWAVRLFKGLPRAKAADGRFRVVILMGLDDATPGIVSSQLTASSTGPQLAWICASTRAMVSSRLSICHHNSVRTTR
jgi:putative ABC transport system permease protein